MLTDMARIVAFELHAVDLPFRGEFRHAAAARRRSGSLFLELRLDDGTSGWGESLPRPYVTGETRDGACRLLAERVLPRMLGRGFASFDDAIAFLEECDGRAPAGWVPPDVAQAAAWCAVDLALLDAFGRRFGRRPFGNRSGGFHFRYSGVVSAGSGWKPAAQILAFRLLGMRSLKVKIDALTGEAEIRRIRRLAGETRDLRADVNMGWSPDRALEAMPRLARHGIRCFEQPLAAGDLAGAARLVRETGLDVMADEAFHSRESLRRLVETGACTAVNARISKCGGLVATLARCREARDAGLWVQTGCQVGESSLLSAAQLLLCGAFPDVRHAEGCFGKLLLREDPAAPVLRFGFGGRPPSEPSGPGLGVRIDRATLARHRAGHWRGGGPVVL